MSRGKRLNKNELRRMRKSAPVDKQCSQKCLCAKIVSRYFAHIYTHPHKHPTTHKRTHTHTLFISLSNTHSLFIAPVIVWVHFNERADLQIFRLISLSSFQVNFRLMHGPSISLLFLSCLNFLFLPETSLPTDQ